MPIVEGIDVSEAISESDWTTLIDNLSLDFAIVRCYRNAQGGLVDSNCLPTLKNAQLAGLADLAVYHFPVLQSKTPEDQAAESIDLIVTNSLDITCLWLDVESGSPWSSDVARNRDFISRFVSTVKAAGVPAGIYCGTDGWQSITGDSQMFADLPLWWSSHGHRFEDFGGWTSPDITQYLYDQRLSGISYDGSRRGG